MERVTGGRRGFVVVGVAAREELPAWAAEIAAACRCAQEVREILPGRELEAMPGRAEGRR